MKYSLERTNTVRR